MHIRKDKNVVNPKIAKGVCTVIEFSQHSIKLIQSRLDKQGLRFISKLFIKDNISGAEQEFIAELEKIIRDNHLNIDDLIVCLERSLVTIRSVVLPSFNEEEIGNMAQLQAVKYLPYKLDEMVVSHQTIKADQSGPARVILVITPRDIVKKFTGICYALKLRPQFITISTEGLLQWYMNIRLMNIKDTLLLLDIDKGKTELAIISQGKFIFSRSFSLLHIQDDAEKAKKIAEESKLSLDYYRKQEIFQEINKIVLTGDKTKVPGLPNLLERTFEMPVEPVDYLLNTSFKKSMLNPDEEQRYSFVAAGGLALSQDRPRINLSTPEVKDKVLYFEKKKELFKTAVLALVTALVFAGILSFNFQYKNKVINMLDEQIAKTDPAAKEIADIKNKIDVINSQIDKDNSCIEVLREVHRLTPGQITLNTFLYEESKEVVIRGTSATMSAVFNFVPALNGSRFFQNVEISYATQRKTATGELTDFEIICKLGS